jgi:hypothetical protein
MAKKLPITIKAPRNGQMPNVLEAKAARAPVKAIRGNVRTPPGPDWWDAALSCWRSSPIKAPAARATKNPIKISSNDINASLLEKSSLPYYPSKSNSISNGTKSRVGEKYCFLSANTYFHERHVFSHRVLGELGNLSLVLSSSIKKAGKKGATYLEIKRPVVRNKDIEERKSPIKGFLNGAERGRPVNLVSEKMEKTLFPKWFLFERKKMFQKRSAL